MSDELNELVKLAERLCEAAGWKYLGVGSDGWLEFSTTHDGFNQLEGTEWLPLAKAIEERDRLRDELAEARAEQERGSWGKSDWSKREVESEP